MAQAPRNKLCLARRSAGRMPCKPKSGTFSLREKSGSPPPRPRRYFRAAEIRYLARKQSARDKSILLFRLYMDQKNWIAKILSRSEQP